MTPAYYMGIHQYSYRANELAEIIDIGTYYPDGYEPRVCFHIKYADGKEDYCPVLDYSNYKIYTYERVTLGLYGVRKSYKLSF